MARHVKGVLFGDYVRMLRIRKHEDFSAWLTADDLQYLRQPIDPAGWYPMATFERLGLAILALIAGGDLEAAHAWGRISVDRMAARREQLVSPGDPGGTMRRFNEARSNFFDFDGVWLERVDPTGALVRIDYGMSPKAEEAAAQQTRGFFERLLELADARDIEAHFVERSWVSYGPTMLRITWTR
jgi:hypothetical protein